MKGEEVGGCGRPLRASGSGERWSPNPLLVPMSWREEQADCKRQQWRRQVRLRFENGGAAPNGSSSQDITRGYRCREAEGDLNSPQVAAAITTPSSGSPAVNALTCAGSRQNDPAGETGQKPFEQDTGEGRLRMGTYATVPVNMQSPSSLAPALPPSHPLPPRPFDLVGIGASPSPLGLQFALWLHRWNIHGMFTGRRGRSRLHRQS